MMKKMFLVIATMCVAICANAAERLDGCNPSARENQSITGAVWKSKCLNAKVNEVWLASYDNMTLAEAKRTSSKNGAWKLFSQIEYAKTKPKAKKPKPKKKK